MSEVGAAPTGQLAARRLILVTHAPPEIVPTLPANQWRLSDEGRRRCRPLAERLAAWAPVRLIASQEPKATETAALVAQHLGCPWETAAGLHEHERSAAGFLGDAEFAAAVAALFAQPGRLVFGSETAAAAERRFAAAVAAPLRRVPAGNLAIVAHGTVMALYVGARAGLSPHALWQRLGLPSFVVLALPAGAVETVVEAV